MEIIDIINARDSLAQYIIICICWLIFDILT